MKKRIIPTLLCSIMSSHAFADNIGVYFGGHVWDSETKGSYGTSKDQVNFDFEDKKQGSYFIAVEHPLPLIPNARISSTTLETQGITTLARDYKFDDETFQKGDNISTNFDISYIDYTLYYELFDNDLVSVDFGITGRDFDGDISVSATRTTNEGTVSQSDSIGIGSVVPMLYVATNVGLPFTGWNVFAKGNFLSVGDHSLYDYQAGISYELVDNAAIDINIDAGYRGVKLTLEDLNDLYSDIDFNGVFLGTTIHF